MNYVAVVSQEGKRLWFEEDDVRQACRMMRCGEHADECIQLMKHKAIGCVLCYVVLKTLKKPHARREPVTKDRQPEAEDARDTFAEYNYETR